MISIFLAYLNYRSNTKKQEEDKKQSRDKEVLEQSIMSLEWAYDTLTEGKYTELPTPSRLNWLTAARHISRYYSLKKLIETETYKLLCAEKEEYWRHKFYVLFDRVELMNKNYFIKADDEKWPENIAPTSAMVIVDFSSWSKSIVDPLDAIDRNTLIEKGNPFSGSCGRGLKAYCDEMEEASARMAARNKT